MLSTAASSASIVMTTPPATAASPALAARVAPLATSGSAFDAVRLYTRNCIPAATRLADIGKPIAPNPINPASVIIVDSFRYTTVGKDFRSLAFKFVYEHRR